MSESPDQPNLPSQELPWEVAVTFNAALGWPILRTQTEQMSPTGAVICSDHGNLTGAKVSLILESPPGEDGQTDVLSVEARVTSSVAAQQQGQYRHQLKFVRSSGNRAGASNPPPAGTPQAPAAPSTQPATPLSHLDKLKALAQQKLVEEQARKQQAAQRQPNAATEQASAKATAECIEKALQQTYGYFKELVEQLNVLKPDFPRQYAVPGLPEFGSMRWNGGRANSFSGRQADSKLERLERVALNYTLTGGNPLRLDREYPASDRLKTLLNDYKIAFSSQEVRNARGSLECVKFEVPLTVDAGLQLTAKYDEGKIQINATHIAGFGSMRRLVAPEVITEATLNELSGYILGETIGQLPRLLQGGD